MKTANISTAPTSAITRPDRASHRKGRRCEQNMSEEWAPLVNSEEMALRVKRLADIADPQLRREALVSESAYRRGYQHGVEALVQLLGLHDDDEAVKQARHLAHLMRYDSKAHPRYMDEFIRRAVDPTAHTQ